MEALLAWEDAEEPTGLMFLLDFVHHTSWLLPHIPPWLQQETFQAAVDLKPSNAAQFNVVLCLVDGKYQRRRIIYCVFEPFSHYWQYGNWYVISKCCTRSFHVDCYHSCLAKIWAKFFSGFRFERVSLLVGRVGWRASCVRVFICLYSIAMFVFRLWRCGSTCWVAISYPRHDSSCSIRSGTHSVRELVCISYFPLQHQRKDRECDVIRHKALLPFYTIPSRHAAHQTYWIVWKVILPAMYGLFSAFNPLNYMMPSIILHSKNITLLV